MIFSKEVCPCDNLLWSVIGHNHDKSFLIAWMRFKVKGVPFWQFLYDQKYHTLWMYTNPSWRKKFLKPYWSIRTVFYTVRGTISFQCCNCLWLVANQIGFLHKNFHSGCSRPTRWPSWNISMKMKRIRKTLFFGLAAKVFVRFGLQQALLKCIMKWPLTLIKKRSTANTQAIKTPTIYKHRQRP